MTRDRDVAALSKRCSHSLGWARKFLELGEYIKSIQDSYFAAFYAAKATLSHLGVRSKSHRSVQDRIDDLVAEGALPPHTGDVLELLLARRNEAAYRFARGNWTEQEASEVLGLAERFITEMRRVFESP